MSETEKLLLRSLAADRDSPLFALAAEAFDAHPDYFAGLSTAPLLATLRGRGGADALASIEEPAGRGLLAGVLMAEGTAMEPADLRAAIESLRHSALVRAQREARAAIAEAERRGDAGRVAELMRRKQELDGELRGF